jgi:hypothetical protein
VEADGRCRAAAAAQWGGGSPRFSAYELGLSRVCGESYSTAIVGLRAPVTPLYLCAAKRRGSITIHGKRPQLGRGLDWFSNFKDLSKRKGDHIPNKKYTTSTR